MARLIDPFRNFQTLLALSEPTKMNTWLPHKTLLAVPRKGSSKLLQRQKIIASLSLPQSSFYTFTSFPLEVFTALAYGVTSEPRDFLPFLFAFVHPCPQAYMF